MSKMDIIRLDRLEERLKDLERNVGAIASELNLVAVATRESYTYYREGYDNSMHMNNAGKPKMVNSEILNYDKGAFNIRETKTALVINGTPIYEYDGTAIYDLHTPSKLACIWKKHIFDGGGVIRGMTVSDIKKFFYENPEFAAPGFFNIVQDINHMSDIYIVDITK